MTPKTRQNKYNYNMDTIFEGNISWTQNDQFVIDGVITFKNENIKVKGNIETMFPQLREKYDIRSMKIHGRRRVL
jgi:hypothetical protein